MTVGAESDHCPGCVCPPVTQFVYMVCMEIRLACLAYEWCRFPTTFAKSVCPLFDVPPDF